MENVQEFFCLLHSYHIWIIIIHQNFPCSLRVLKNINWQKILQSGMFQFYFIVLPEVSKFENDIDMIWNVLSIYLCTHWKLAIFSLTCASIFCFKNDKISFMSILQQMSWKNERTCTFGTWHDGKSTAGLSELGGTMVHSKVGD